MTCIPYATPLPRDFCNVPKVFRPKCTVQCALTESVAEARHAPTVEPLLLRAVRGEVVERPPVWLMRQAGRYMKSYQELCEKYPLFRDRSENVDLVVEISLQPWKAFRPDGVILFSDILTPLTGMNIPFDIIKGKGPHIYRPIQTLVDVAEVREFVPQESVPYVGEALSILRAEVNDGATVLGFVGAPFTLASYVIEGGSSKHFTKIKRLAFCTPKVLLDRSMLDTNLLWTIYGVRAQLIQLFGICIISQTAGFFSTKRNWSIDGFIHSMNQKKLGPRRVDLVYIHSNIFLLSREDANFKSIHSFGMLMLEI